MLHAKQTKAGGPYPRLRDFFIISYSFFLAIIVTAQDKDFATPRQGFC